MLSGSGIVSSFRAASVPIMTSQVKTCWKQKLFSSHARYFVFHYPRWSETGCPQWCLWLILKKQSTSLSTKLGYLVFRCYSNINDFMDSFVNTSDQARHCGFWFSLEPTNPKSNFQEFSSHLLITDFGTFTLGSPLACSLFVPLDSLLEACIHLKKGIYF